jgi:hypothetical protein
VVLAVGKLERVLPVELLAQLLLVPPAKVTDQLTEPLSPPFQFLL